MSATITPESAHNPKRFANLETVVGQRMWPTPRCFMHKDAGYDRGKANLGEVIAGVEGGTQENPIGGHLNPTWVEWLMGWPLEWTDLNPSATDKFQQWLHSHGK